MVGLFVVLPEIPALPLFMNSSRNVDGSDHTLELESLDSNTSKYWRKALLIPCLVVLQG